MSNLVYRISNLLNYILNSVAIGTNAGLYQLLWALLAGGLLKYRGSVTPALASFGLDKVQVRRSQAALADGKWKIGALVAALQKYILREEKWNPMCQNRVRQNPVPKIV